MEHELQMPPLFDMQSCMLCNLNAQLLIPHS